MSQPQALTPPAVFGAGEIEQPALAHERPQLDTRFSEKTDIEAPAHSKAEENSDSDAASSIEQGIGVTKIEALCESPSEGIPRDPEGSS